MACAGVPLLAIYLVGLYAMLKVAGARFIARGLVAGSFGSLALLQFGLVYEPYVLGGWGDGTVGLWVPPVLALLVLLAGLPTAAVRWTGEETTELSQWGIAAATYAFVGAAVLLLCFAKFGSFSSGAAVVSGIAPFLLVFGLVWVLLRPGGPPGASSFLADRWLSATLYAVSVAALIWYLGRVPELYASQRVAAPPTEVSVDHGIPPAIVYRYHLAGLVWTAAEAVGLVGIVYRP